jgi:hypothetical protein
MHFFASHFKISFYSAPVTVETFQPEIAEALQIYQMYVVCIDKTPEEFEASLVSLLTKAMRAFESRGPQLRHGIALDKHVTVILSQSDGPHPLCGIYFNLHSPYQKQSSPRIVTPISQPIEDRRQASENC